MMRKVTVIFKGAQHQVTIENGATVGELRHTVAARAQVPDLADARYRIFYYDQLVSDETAVGSLADLDSLELKPVFDVKPSSSELAKLGVKRGRQSSIVVVKGDHNTSADGLASCALRAADPTCARGAVEEPGSRDSPAMKAERKEVVEDFHRSGGGGGPSGFDGAELSVPIVTGNWARWRGQGAPEKQTHEWKCYVRGLYNQDLSDIVDSVTFVLHQTFERPERTVTNPPFEISELGWGEFEVLIHVHLKHTPARCRIPFVHFLSFANRPKRPHAIPPVGVPLGPYMPAPFRLQPHPVISEVFDEIVVQSPTPQLRSLLRLHSFMTAPSLRKGVSVWEDIKLHYRKAGSLGGSQPSSASKKAEAQLENVNDLMLDVWERLHASEVEELRTILHAINAKHVELEEQLDAAAVTAVSALL